MFYGSQFHFQLKQLLKFAIMIWFTIELRKPMNLILNLSRVLSIPEMKAILLIYQKN